MRFEQISVLLERQKLAALDEIAAVTERDRNAVLNEAISLYLEIQQSQIQEISQGVAEAEAGDFATAEEVRSVLAQLTDSD